MDPLVVGVIVNAKNVQVLWSPAELGAKSAADHVPRLELRLPVSFGSGSLLGVVWINGDVGIGSNDPQPPIDPSRVQAVLADPALRQALEDAGLGSLDDILALRAGSLKPVVDGPMLTDDRPVLEYFATLPFLTRAAYGGR